MKIYKIDLNTPHPIEQEVDAFGFPNLDADGKEQYLNTHFADIEKAWDALGVEIQALVSFRAHEVKRLRDELDQAEDKLVDAAVLQHDAKTQRQIYENKKRMK